MRKLHDLKIMLSTDTQLSRQDCMRIKGGTDDKRRDRTGTTTEELVTTITTVATGGDVGGSYGG